MKNLNQKTINKILAIALAISYVIIIGFIVKVNSEPTFTEMTTCTYAATGRVDDANEFCLKYADEDWHERLND